MHNPVRSFWLAGSLNFNSNTFSPFWLAAWGDGGKITLQPNPIQWVWVDLTRLTALLNTVFIPSDCMVGLWGIDRGGEWVWVIGPFSTSVFRELRWARWAWLSWPFRPTVLTFHSDQICREFPTFSLKQWRGCPAQIWYYLYFRFVDFHMAVPLDRSSSSQKWMFCILCSFLNEYSLKSRAQLDSSYQIHISNFLLRSLY